MPDFDFITPRLATGAALSGPADVEALQQAGVTHVIDCRAEFNDAPLLGPNFQYLWNGVPDDGQPKPASWFQRSIQFALPALALPHVRVYAHCAAGVNRGPSTAYAIMLAEGWIGDAAAALIEQKRPQAKIGYRADADAAIPVLGYN